MAYIPSPSSASSLPNTSSQYDCPSTFSPNGTLKSQAQLEGELQSWIRDAREEGLSYLKQCRSYSDIEKAIETIVSQIQTTLPDSISKIFVPSIKRNIKEMVAILSNIRPSWLYEARSDDANWAQQARIQNALSKDWYERRFIDREIKKLLQLGLVEGTGYLSPIWNPHFHGQNKGGIELKLYRYNEVLPVQLPSDFNLQKAYAVILVDEMGINRARRTFYQKASQLVPDRAQSKSSTSIISSAVKGFWDAIRGADSPKKRTSSGPVIDILYIYVDDFSINPTNHSVQMGEEGASWSYKVPFVGQDIPDGFNMDGSPKTRKAKVDDCLLYPNRRLIIASRTCILYDGPSFWWHGQVPIIKYSPDEWIFSYLGFSMAAEVSSMQISAIKMRRALEDALHLTIDPPTAVDETMISKTVASSSSLRTPGRKIRGKLAMGKFMEPILDPSYYRPSSEHFAMVSEVEEKIKEILGLPDLKNLQMAKQVPSADSMEKFFSQAGAIVTDMSRTLDKPIYELADMIRYYFFQFYTLEDRIKIMGSDGITSEDFDFKPASLIPASLPDEKPNSLNIFLSSNLERAKHHINNFKTSIHPTSLHQITHMQKKLLYMQAEKIFPGFPMIDPESLANTLDIENWGKLEGDTKLAKIKSFLEMQEKFGLKTKFDSAMVDILVQQMAQAQSPQNQLAQGMQGLAEGIKGSMDSSSSSSQDVHPPGQVGRPPEFNGAPTLENKGGRTTITGSGNNGA